MPVLLEEVEEQAQLRLKIWHICILDAAKFQARACSTLQLFCHDGNSASQRKQSGGHDQRELNRGKDTEQHRLP